MLIKCYGKINLIASVKVNSDEMSHVDECHLNVDGMNEHLTIILPEHRSENSLNEFSNAFTKTCIILRYIYLKPVDLSFFETSTCQTYLASPSLVHQRSVINICTEYIKCARIVAPEDPEAEHEFVSTLSFTFV